MELDETSQAISRSLRWCSVGTCLTPRSRPLRVTAEGRRNPFPPPLLAGPPVRWRRPLLYAGVIPSCGHVADAERDISCRVSTCRDGQPSEALGSRPGLLGDQSQEQERWEVWQRRQPQARSPAELSQAQVPTLPQLRCSTKLIFIITKVSGQWNPNGLFLVIETVS